MILGLGNDLIDIRRIEKTIEKHGERFLARVYTDIERAKSDRRAGTHPCFDNHARHGRQCLGSRRYNRLNSRCGNHASARWPGSESVGSGLLPEPLRGKPSTGQG